MLILKDILKDYTAGDTTVTALKGVSFSFRENEFVSVLGPSGCGKTTLLNIIGGLDRYTSGDLIINGKSTKEFSDSDWDTYRNHSIGFVFQSYNLIPHQTVLANVELALTLSGVSKKERRERAKEALEKVGLGSQINKKPNQMSGGQMQRVAIARALINNPDILLADEPTGALDSETSVQIMDILREISGKKLIIMVTHNPELAEKYSDRIIRLKDGEVTDDTNPYTPTEEEIASQRARTEAELEKGKKSMSFMTALTLSLQNLMTKKTRTILTSFAGSIGIIGIALILALSTGIQDYIADIQEELLLSMPMSIEQDAMDMDTMVSTLTGIGEAAQDTTHELDAVYVNNTMDELIKTFVAGASANNVKAFRQYIEENRSDFDKLCNSIVYNYGTQLNIYREDTGDGILQVNPSTLADSFNTGSYSDMMKGFSSMSFDSWIQLIGDKKLLESQYDVVAGRMPENFNEVVVMVDKNYEMNQMVQYALGLKDQSQFTEYVMNIIAGDSADSSESSEKSSYSYDDIMNLKFRLVLNNQYYSFDKDKKTWKDMRSNEYFLKDLISKAQEIKIVGIICPGEDVTISTGTGGIGYLPELMDWAINQNANSEIVKQQLADTSLSVLTGEKYMTLTADQIDLTQVDLSAIDFKYLDYTAFLDLVKGVDLSTVDITDISSMFNFDDITEFQKMLMEGYLSDEQVYALKEAYVKTLTEEVGTLETTYSSIGYATQDSPISINMYPKSFEAKAQIEKMVDYYNQQVSSEGHPGYAINVTDYISIVMGSVTKIIDIVTYVLIAFVGISLVVSSIMIGIITYISVLERTKEIGILRGIGASKRDVSRVFNAETLIVGFGAGAIGILTTLLLELPINLILEHLTQVNAAANLHFTDALILIAISMALTLIAGLIPSRLAAKKNPVEALRTE